MRAVEAAKAQVSPAAWPLRGILFVAARPATFRRFLQAAVVYAAASAAALAVTASLLFGFQYRLLVSLLGPTWLSWQVASGAVLAESAFPLHLLLQYTQGELANSLFKGVLREVGVAQPAVLPPGQAAEVQGAAAARRRARGAALTGPAAVITAPAQLLADLLNGRPGDGWLKGWVRLTASGPLLVFWPYGPALYAWINGYATGISHHQAYFQAKGVTDREEQEAIAQSRAGQYRRFGATAMGLSLLPIVGWGLSVLSAAGAALWAAELEGSGGRQPGRLYQGGPTVFDGQEYGLVEMEEGSTAIKR